MSPLAHCIEGALASWDSYGGVTMTEREMSYGTGGTRSGRSRSEDYSDPFDTQYGEKAQTKASEYGEKAQMKADQGLDKAATAADKAASQLREKAMQQGGKTGEI